MTVEWQTSSSSKRQEYERKGREDGGGYEIETSNGAGRDRSKRRGGETQLLAFIGSLINLQFGRYLLISFRRASTTIYIHTRCGLTVIGVRRQQRLRKPFRDASPSTSTSSYKSFPGRLTSSVDPSYSASPQITQFATFFPVSRFTKLFLWFLSSRFSLSPENSKFIQAPQPIGNAIRPVRLMVDILSQSRALFDKLDTTQPKCNYDK